MCIAVADTMVILGVFVYKNVTLNRFPNILDSIHLTKMLCKIITFTRGFGLDWNSMLFASVTIERFISIAFALKIKTFNLLRISKILLFIYFVSCTSVNGLNAYFTENLKSITDIICSFEPQNFPIRDMVTTIVIGIMFVCAGIILIFTILTAIFLYKYKEKRKALEHPNGNSGKEFQVSLMLFIVACIFIATRFPETILNTFTSYLAQKQKFDNPNFINAAIVRPIIDLLVLINHSINFVIYFIFLKPFRETCIGYFCCKLCKK